MDDAPLDPEILRYYDHDWDEDARMREGIGQLEFLRIQEIVRRHLPAGSMRILDVGGASGIHAAWLLEDGHRVRVIDPVPSHIERAEAELGWHLRFSAEVGDARSLPVRDASQDVVLLMGPLYHLIERTDRMRAWREASRALVPGGLVIAAVITRFASLFSGLSSGDLFDPDFRAVVDQDLAIGQHRNPEGKDWFTTAYFHHPDEVRTEAAEAGLGVEALYGVEGIAAWIPDLEQSWGDPVRREVIIEAARAIETEPALAGLGPHLVLVATAP